MGNHHVKLFIEDGEIVYIHHNPGNPSNDVPGKHVSGPTGDKVRFMAPSDGAFTVEFKTESPFVSQAGQPGTPIQSMDGSPTKLETLKTIGPVKKSFKYTVTLGGIVDDPEILIDNSGGTPKSPKKKSGKKKK
jgi:hypothetical protein